MENGVQQPPVCVESRALSLVQWDQQADHNESEPELEALTGIVAAAIEGPQSQVLVDFSRLHGPA